MIRKQGGSEERTFGNSFHAWQAGAKLGGELRWEMCSATSHAFNRAQIGNFETGMVNHLVYE